MKTFPHIILFLCLAIHLDAADVREFRAVPVKKAIFSAYSPLDDIMFVVFLGFTALAIYVAIVFRRSRPPHVSAYKPSSLIILSSGVYRQFGESGSGPLNEGVIDEPPVRPHGVTIFVARSFEGLSEEAVHRLQSVGVNEGKAYLKRAMPHLRQDTYRYIRDINPQLTDKNICMLFGLPA